MNCLITSVLHTALPGRLIQGIAEREIERPVVLRMAAMLLGRRAHHNTPQPSPRDHQGSHISKPILCRITPLLPCAASCPPGRAVLLAVPVLKELTAAKQLPVVRVVTDEGGYYCRGLVTDKGGYC